MHILFLTHYFPPEVNAPATRTYENTRRWVQAGHDVTVITCAPNHPKGIVYPGFQNALWQWDEINGIKILRVKTYLSANKGFLKRILNYVSYLIAAVFFCPLAAKADIVVSTSPQFFCGMAGYFVSSLKRCKWVLEIRDLWPESIIAVGALKQPCIIKILESIESFMYRKSDHIISVTNSFKKHISQRNIADDKISIITNGADLDNLHPVSGRNSVSEEYSLSNKFIASFIGTHGMAHALQTVFHAADLLREKKDILFLLVGDGAERENLLKLKEEMKLDNVLMVPQQPKEKVNEFLAVSNACMVLLKKNDLFKTVIPSKIFEAMAMERPIIIGVEGESKNIIEKAKCGISIEPENHHELAESVLKLNNDKKLADNLGKNGKQYVIAHFNRDELANDYRKILENMKIV